MKDTKKETIKTVIQFIVSVLTALLATLGVQSCVCNLIVECGMLSVELVRYAH